MNSINLFNNKICGECKVEKTPDMFIKVRRNTSLSKFCIPCREMKTQIVKEKRYISHKLYCENNRENLRAYNKERYSSNIIHKLSVKLRTRISKFLKAGSSVKDLGCSVDGLKTHLETQFKPGMTWENQGEWHIDHIIPLSRFNLTERQEFLKACHYTNLQPLWAKENLSKGNR